MADNMTATNYDEGELIDAYLRGKLGQDALNDFEVQMLEDQRLFKAVQQRTAIVEALKAERAAVSSSAPKLASSSVVVEFRQWLRQPYSIAASLVAAFSVAALVGTIMPGGETGPTMSSIPVASNLILETVRGDDRTITASGKGPVLLTIDVGPVAPDALFDVTIVDSAGDAVVSEMAASVDDQGWLRLVLNRNFAGNYTVNVFNAGSSSLLQSSSVQFKP